MWKQPWFGGFLAFTVLGGISWLLHGGLIAPVLGGAYMALIMWAEPWLKQRLRRRWTRLIAAALLRSGGWAVGIILVHEISHRPWRWIDAVSLMTYILVGVAVLANYDDPLDLKKRRPAP